MLSFTEIEFIDLFFRFAAVGCLVFIKIVWVNERHSLYSWMMRGLLLCITGYLLLTAPIDDGIYGHFRGVVLLLTELLPYLLWLSVLYLIKPEHFNQPISFAIKVVVLLSVIWFVYFFVIQQGRGAFHQVNHIFGILLFCHITFMALYDLKDDLVPNRRKFRVTLALFFGAYSSCLALFELFDLSLRASEWFGLANSATILLLIMLFSRLALKGEEPKTSIQDKIVLKKEGDETVPLKFKSLFSKLNKLIEQHFYTESNLTIGVLANKLNEPEHRVRLLINNHLGYQNFSAFLNHYRIPAAKKSFQDESQINLPILTIALELGYGSIGPFNRAFKQLEGITPSEFRQNVQNQR